MTPEVGDEDSAYDATVRIEQRRPDASFHLGPVHDFYVVFWRQPLMPEAELRAAVRMPGADLRAGVTQEQVMWAAAEHYVQEADDVHGVIAWAEEEARRRRAIYTLYAVIAIGDEEGLIWLAGVDPTKARSPNFERRHPPDVDPVSGTPAEVYRPVEGL
jgi:hypothetical protein